MNIIFGDAVEHVADTHTVLELDTFKLMPSQRLVRTWCVVDTVPLAEFPRLEINKNIHQQLITNYQQKNWQFCRSAVTALKGTWNGELDSFYDNLLDRINDLDKNPPAEDWSACLIRFESAE